MSGFKSSQETGKAQEKLQDHSLRVWLLFHMNVLETKQFAGLFHKEMLSQL